MAKKEPEVETTRPRRPIVYMAVVILLVILIAVSYPLLIKGPPNTDPESTLRAYADFSNEQDGEAAVDLTVLVFGPPIDYDRQVETVEVAGSMFRIEVDDIRVIYKSQMSSDYNIELINVTDSLESLYNITISDYCVLNYSRTYNYYSGEVAPQGYANFGCVKVEGLWYLCGFPYYE